MPKLASRRSKVRRRFCLETSTTLLLRLRSTAERSTSRLVLVSKIRTDQRWTYPPGKYKYSIKLQGKPLQSVEVELGVDEVWGLTIGPGGVLALQAY